MSEWKRVRIDMKVWVWKKGKAPKRKTLTTDEEFEYWRRNCKLVTLHDVPALQNKAGRKAVSPATVVREAKRQGYEA